MIKKYFKIIISLVLTVIMICPTIIVRATENIAASDKGAVDNSANYTDLLQIANSKGLSFNTEEEEDKFYQTVEDAKTNGKKTLIYRFPNTTNGRNNMFFVFDDLSEDYIVEEIAGYGVGIGYGESSFLLDKFEDTNNPLWTALWSGTYMNYNEHFQEHVQVDADWEYIHNAQEESGILSYFGSVSDVGTLFSSWAESAFIVGVTNNGKKPKIIQNNNIFMHTWVSTHPVDENEYINLNFLSTSISNIDFVSTNEESVFCDSNMKCVACDIKDCTFTGFKQVINTFLGDNDTTFENCAFSNGENVLSGLYNKYSFKNCTFNNISTPIIAARKNDFVIQYLLSKNFNTENEYISDYLFTREIKSLKNMNVNEIYKFEQIYGYLYNLNLNENQYFSEIFYYEARHLKALCQRIEYISDNKDPDSLFSDTSDDDPSRIAAAFYVSSRIINAFSVSANSTDYLFDSCLFNNCKQTIKTGKNLYEGYLNTNNTDKQRVAGWIKTYKQGNLIVSNCDFVNSGFEAIDAKISNCSFTGNPQNIENYDESNVYSTISNHDITKNIIELNNNKDSPISLCSSELIGTNTISEKYQGLLIKIFVNKDNDNIVNSGNLIINNSECNIIMNINNKFINLNSISLINNTVNKGLCLSNKFVNNGSVYAENNQGLLGSVVYSNEDISLKNFTTKNNSKNSSKAFYVDNAILSLNSNNSINDSIHLAKNASISVKSDIEDVNCKLSFDEEYKTVGRDVVVLNTTNYLTSTEFFENFTSDECVLRDGSNYINKRSIDNKDNKTIYISEKYTISYQNNTGRGESLDLSPQYYYWNEKPVVLTTGQRLFDTSEIKGWSKSENTSNSIISEDIEYSENSDLNLYALSADDNNDDSSEPEPAATDESLEDDNNPDNEDENDDDEEETEDDIQEDATLIVKYLDENNKNLCEDLIYDEYGIDDEYKTESKSFKNYTLLGIPENASGVLSENTVIVIYRYSLNSSTVKVKHVDKNGNKLAEDEVIEAKIGSNYTTAAKTIKSYDFSSVTDNATGTILPDEITVIYTYELKNAKVIIKYVNEEGKEISESSIINGKINDEYETKPLEIDSYVLSSSPDNKKGIMTEDDIVVTYVYKFVQEETKKPAEKKKETKKPVKAQEKTPHTGYDSLSNMAMFGAMISSFGLIITSNRKRRKK